MTCHSCKVEMVKAGLGRNQIQRYKCRQCGKRFCAPRQRPFGADVRLPVQTVVSILRCLVEGNSVRSTARLCDVEPKTVLSMLELAGEACERLFEEKIKRVRATDVQCDEIWGFVRKKERNRSPLEAHDASIGDAYCFVALDRNTKLVLAWHLGKRTKVATMQFIRKLADATNHREHFQLTTDGFRPYLDSVEYILADRVSFAQLVKTYAMPREGHQRYSPSEIIDVTPQPIYGNPDPDRICTSHVERLNLGIRMGMRRMTRLTNAFSKKWENLRAAYALHFAYYNFCRVHQTLRITPAMQAGIADHVWTLQELIG